MDGLDKKILPSPIRFVANEILARAASIPDATTVNPLFESVGSGVWIPKDNPNAKNNPAFRLWYRHPVYDTDGSPQFFMGHRRVMFSMGIYLWYPEKDAQGEAVDPMMQLIDLTDHVLSAFQLKDEAGIGWNWTERVWGPVPKQIVEPDFEGRMRAYNKNTPVEPPWWCVEIPFLADVWNLDLKNGDGQ